MVMSVDTSLVQTRSMLRRLVTNGRPDEALQSILADLCRRNGATCGVIYQRHDTRFFPVASSGCDVLPTPLDVATGSLIPENRFLIHYGTAVIGLLTLDDLPDSVELTTDPVMALLLDGAAFSLRWRDMLEEDMPMVSIPVSLPELESISASDEFTHLSGQMDRDDDSPISASEFARVKARLHSEVEIARRELAEHTAMLDLRGRAIASARNGIIITDATNRTNPIVYVNPAFERMTGYTSDEIIGQDYRILEGPETDPDTALTVRRSVQQGRACQVTILSYRRDGSSFWNELSISPVHDTRGDLSHFIGVVDDVSDRLEAERRARMLAQGEKMRALGKMSAGVVHDLNQFLSLITGHGEMALRLLDHPAMDITELRESMSMIVRAALDGAQTVNRLQAFARPRSDRAPERVDIGTVLDDVAKLTKPTWQDAPHLEGRPIALEIAVEGETAIMGDPSLLREALTNLVFNAVDAMPDGGAILLIARRLAENVVSEVVDSGIGMSSDVRTHVFEPFFSTKGERGTGLGLALVFTTIEQHKGDISIHSTPGLGTTIRMTIPAAGEKVIAVAPTELMVTPPTHARRILAVDDDDALVCMLRRMLELRGHTVSIAHSGEEAQRLLALDRYDIVVSDLGMGSGMNGWDLAASVRDTYPDIRFILATGWGAQVDTSEAMMRGVNHIVAKPYRVAHLYAAIDGHGQTSY